MKLHRRLAAWALATSLVAVLAACGGSDDSGSDAGGVDTIRLGMVPGGNFNSLAPLVALEQGFFEDQGLEVEIVDLAGGPQMVSAIASGSIDVMLNSPGNGMLANAAGQHLVGIVAGFQAPAYTWIAQEDWDTPNEGKGFPAVAKDFKGAVVGVPVLASEIENMTRAFAAEAGLDPDQDLQYVAIGTGAQAIGAFEAGQVDIYVATEPGPTTLLDGTHDAKAMLDLRNPDEVPGILGGWTSIVYQADRKNAEENPEKFEKFAAAIAAANDFMQEDKDGTVAAYGQSLDMDEAVRAAIYDANHHSISSVVDCGGFDSISTFLVNAGLLTEDQTQDCESFMWSGSGDYQE
ncbi:ABC transporter substrate-binding protein [Aeromicrobium sp.]|uniref:ABC transporter substrate-binding protein n=1 Tax=Aeromicrobium sp. TaxID=1871063 RepID=UPI0025BC918E|nr:ABC transporter substrate-binding protein [Aeromicrobium sp.]MCK5892580.1 ABC transporter substrate-binding protein [Aeromicrobium sp.]